MALPRMNVVDRGGRRSIPRVNVDNRAGGGPWSQQSRADRLESRRRSGRCRRSAPGPGARRGSRERSQAPCGTRPLFRPKLPQVTVISASALQECQHGKVAQERHVPPLSLAQRRSSFAATKLVVWPLPTLSLHLLHLVCLSPRLGPVGDVAPLSRSGFSVGKIGATNSAILSITRPDHFHGSASTILHGS